MTKSLKLSSFFCFVLLIISFTASAAPQRPKQVIVLIGGVSLSDLSQADLPFIKETIVNAGALALLNNRTAAGYSPENCYLSLGSGSRARAPESVRHFFQFREETPYGPGEFLFHRYRPGESYQKGTDPFPEAFNPFLGAVIRSLDTINYSVPFGYLGELLQEAKIPSLLLGAGDSHQEVNRSASLILTLADGTLPSTCYREPLKIAPDYPGGLKTDYSKLLSLITAAGADYDLIVVETGDFLRLYSETDLMSAAAIESWRRRLLSEVDAFLRELTLKLPTPTRYWLVSAYPSKDAHRSGNPITFIGTWGAGVSPGLLVSPTTRRIGLVTNTDFLPSILSTWKLTAPRSYGSAATIKKSNRNKLSFLLSLNERWVKVNSFRAPVLKGYVISQIIVMLLGISVLLWQKLQPLPAIPFPLVKIITALCLAETLPPLTLLVAAAFPPSTWLFALAAFIIPLLLGFLLREIAPLFPVFAGIGLLTGLLLVLDACLGWGLAAGSLLGYDPIGGARFYGIGNEYMGVLIGSFFMGWAALWEAFKPVGWRLAGLLSLGLLVVLGSPGLGANVGGTIGLTLGIMAWFLLGLSRRIRLRHLILTGLGVAGILALLILYDLYLNPSLSHLGRFVLKVYSQGPGEIIEVFGRKLAMNWKLLHYTVWADGLLSFIIGLGLIFWRPQGLAKQLKEKYPRIIQGFWTTFVATVTVLLVNDSGVVAAATLMLFPAFILLAISLTALQISPLPPSRDGS